MFCKNCGNKITKGNKFCKNCGAPKKEGFIQDILYWFKKNKAPLITLLVIIIIISVVGYYDENKTDYTSYSPNPITSSLDKEMPETPVTKSQSEIQNKISPAVVNIICPGSDTQAGSGGSGTIATPGGFILTNAHIIPQDEYRTVHCD